MHLSLPKWFPLFILASSDCKSLQRLISSLTQGAKVVTCLGSLFQLCCGEGGTLQTNITSVYGEYSQCLGHTEFAPGHVVYAFPVCTAQAPGCSAGELSKSGPGFCALPRSKLLRFRFLGTPQRHRFGCTCILCPSQVRVAQATRCLASTLSQVVCASYHLPGPSCSISWCAVGVPSQVRCVSPLGS